MAAILTGRAQDEGRTHGIAMLRVPAYRISHLRSTVSTLAAGVARVDAAGDETAVPCLVLRIPEDTALHPVRPLQIATMTILALLRLEIAQVFKDNDAGSLRDGKLHNPAADPVGFIVVTVAELLEASGVILLPLGNHACFTAVLCNASKLPLPKAIYRIAPAYEAGGEDRTFGSLDRTHGDIFS